MDQISSVPRVAFVVDLGSTGLYEGNSARIEHLVHLFVGHRIPAIWIVGSQAHASLLHARRSGSQHHELALNIEPTQLQQPKTRLQLRDQLASKIAELSADGETTIDLVAGESEAFRSQETVLAELGIRGVVATRPGQEPSEKPRPLPCGLWQFEPTVRVPQKLSLANIFYRPRLSAKRLIASNPQSTTIVMVESAELGRLNAGKLRGIEKLLREVSWAASRDQLIVSTVGEELVDLARQRAIKPQRSILRVAA